MYKTKLLKHHMWRLIFFLFIIPLSVFPQNRPNIIFILADDLGYGSIGAYGQEKILTPNLDLLAEEGITFKNFYANSLCAPSRASLMTGLNTSKVQIRDNYELGGFEDSLEFGQMPLAPNTITFPKILQAGSYKTALIGKWGLGGPGSTGIPTRQGFDFFYGYLDQKQAHNHYPSHLWRNEEWEPLPNEYFHPHQNFNEQKDATNPHNYAQYKGSVYASDTLTSEALKYIRNNKDNPFFLYLSYTIPHLALQVPEESLKPYLGKFNEQPFSGTYLPHYAPLSAYAAMISRMDDYIGRIMKELKLLGIDENTIVIFTSDNGPERTINNLEFFKAKGNLRGEKGGLYEGGIRVPFIARWPGKIPSGKTSEHISAIWDIFPTILEIAGIENLLWQTDGISILPALTGKGMQKEHEYLYWETHRFGNGIQAVRFGEWKAIQNNLHGEAPGVLEIYNLHNDPEEKENIAEEHPELKEKAKNYFKNRQGAILKQWNFKH